MGAFKSAVITKKGQELLAKVVAGTTKLEFTKIKVSDTKLSGDLASMTGIGTIKQEEKVASVVRKNGSNVTVSASFSKKYGTTVDTLVKLNGIKNKNLINIGQVIKLP